MPMLKAGLEAWADITPWARQVNFYLLKHPEELNHQPLLAKPLEFEQIPEGSDLRRFEPSFTLLDSRAQTLFDELWRQGMRPSKQVNEASKSAATEAHLQDMRRLVSHKYGVELP